MSSCTIGLRTPIDGVATESIRRVGDVVNRGGLVAGVRNNRMDHPRPVNLRAQPRQVRADAAAIAAQETVPVGKSANVAVFAGLTRRASA
jgi:hypothetical protein